jgi:hypothetical protein
MEAYDPALAPRAFGFRNTGAICYLNSFLQVLLGCTPFTRAVLANAAYMGRTRTGAAVLRLVRAAQAEGAGAAGAAAGAAAGPAPLEALSAELLGALVADLKARAPHVVFGGGQESASEALILLLDMMEAPEEKAEKENAVKEKAEKAAPGAGGLPARTLASPITRLFLHRVRSATYCRAPGCAGAPAALPVSRDVDHAVNFNLFREVIPGGAGEREAAEAFARALHSQDSRAAGYLCPRCKGRGEALRRSTLAMAPEILFCMFNLYGDRPERAVPERFALPGADGGRLGYRLVGQVEHAGTCAGGHYGARALRAGGVFVLNDTGVSPGAFLARTRDTYIAVYCFEGASGGAAPPGGGAASGEGPP